MSNDPGEEIKQALRESMNLANIQAPHAACVLFLDLVTPLLRKIIHREVLRNSIHPRVHPPEQKWPDRKLRPMDSEILFLLCNGFSIAQMAEKLKTPVETVRSRRVALYRKLGTTNTAAAIVIALREGLVHLEELNPEERA